MLVPEHMPALLGQGTLVLEALQMFRLCRLHGTNFQTFPGEAVLLVFFFAGREQTESGIVVTQP